MRFLFFLSFCLTSLQSFGATTRQVEWLAENTQYETRIVTLQSDMPGPTVYVVAGVRGDGPAAVYAAQQCGHFELTRGRLVVIPALNRPAFVTRLGDMPGEPATASDLTQWCHPKGHGHEPANTIAKLLWQRIVRDRPAMVVELTEEDGWTGVRRIDPGDITGGSVYRAMCQATGCHQESGEIHLDEDFMEGCLVQRVYQDLHVPALQVVTHNRGSLKTSARQQSLAGRLRLQRKAVETVLVQWDMLNFGPLPRIVSVQANRPQVAVYCDYGARNSHGHGPEWLFHTFNALGGMDFTLVGAADIREGVLDQFDVLYMGGGSSKTEGRCLGPEGRERIRAFIRDGGNYVGVCAGTFLALSYRDDQLGIVKAELLDPKHVYWKKGYPEIQLTDLGRELLEGHGGPLDGDIAISTYSSGPVIKPSDRGEVDYRILAMYHSDLDPKGETTHSITESPSVIQADYGKGTLILFSCHAERPPGPQDWFYRALKAAAF